MAGILRAPRRAALVTIAVVLAAASVTALAESYRGLFDWASRHGLHGVWAAAWPLMVDTFLVVGELALFVALVDRWPARARIPAWAITAAGLAVSVAGNIGHVAGPLADRATAAVPPLAAASALAVGLGVLKRVVAGQPAGGEPASTQIAHDAEQAAQAALRATVAAGNPLSGRQLAERFGLNRAQVASVRQAVLAETNGHGEG